MRESHLRVRHLRGVRIYRRRFATHVLSNPIEDNRLLFSFNFDCRDLKTVEKRLHNFAYDCHCLYQDLRRKPEQCYEAIQHLGPEQIYVVQSTANAIVQQSVPCQVQRHNNNTGSEVKNIHFLDGQIHNHQSISRRTSGPSKQDVLAASSSFISRMNRAFLQDPLIWKQVSAEIGVTQAGLVALQQELASMALEHQSNTVSSGSGASSSSSSSGNSNSSSQRSVSGGIGIGSESLEEASVSEMIIDE